MKKISLLSSVLLLAICVSCGVREKQILDSDTAVHFVTSDYFHRNEGYDWSVVSIQKIAEDSALVKVRSRIDRKRPSKTFSGTGIYNRTKDSITVFSNNIPISFSVVDSVLSISSPSESILSYYCSGGSTLAGKYTFLEEALDSTQLGNPVKEQILNYPSSSISYKVTYDNVHLCISTKGLSIANDTLHHNLNGYKVGHIAVGDLNIDGHPELYVFIYTNTPEKYGSLIAYSPNNGKSLSSIYLPKIEEDKKLSFGYIGHDEMEIVESCLCRRFRIKDTNKTRQIQYKLVPGEAGWLLCLDKILEY